jgi:hypothetical protein
MERDVRLLFVLVVIDAALDWLLVMCCRWRCRGLTYGSVGSLLLLVTLLVGLGLGIVGLLLLVAEGLPLLTELLADLAWKMLVTRLEECHRRNIPNLMPGLSSRTLSRWSLAKNM